MAKFKKNPLSVEHLIKSFLIVKLKQMVNFF